MTGTGTGGLFGFPELRWIAMADLLVNGHIELKTRNDIILGTSKYELSRLVAGLRHNGRAE